MSAIVIVSQVIYSLIFATGLIENLFVLYVIFYVLGKIMSRSLSISLKCIIHLCVADIVTCATLPTLISSLQKWTFGVNTCKLYLALHFLPQFARAFLLTCLGVISYAIHSGSAYGMTSTRVTIMFAGSWILSWFIALPIYAYATVTLRGQNTCNVFWPENLFANDAFVLIYMICVFALPLAVAYFLASKRKENPFPGEDVVMVKSTMNLVLALIAAHLVLLFPHLIGQFALNYYKTAPGYVPNWKRNYSLLAGWIWSSSIILFPWIYHHFSSEFREGSSYAIESIGKLRINYSKIPSPGHLFTKPVQNV